MSDFFMSYTTSLQKMAITEDGDLLFNYSVTTAEAKSETF
jgi:hypothetical protein